MCLSCRNPAAGTAGKIRIGASTPYWIDASWGWICRPCHDQREENEARFLCPECLTIYNADTGWSPYANPAHRLEVARPLFLIVPCAACSLTPDEPRSRCSYPGCDGAVKINGFHPRHRHDYYGRVYCHSHFSNDEVRTCTDCEKVVIKPTDQGVSWDRSLCVSCNGNRFGDIMPLNEWSSHHDCFCSYCDAYAHTFNTFQDDFDEWYDDLETCIMCDYRTNPDYGTWSADDHFFCHACTARNKFKYRCKSCHGLAYNLTSGLCGNCFDGTGYYQCNVGCHGAWFPEGMPCTCDRVYPWNYTPRSFTFLHAIGQSASATQPYIGFELEMEGTTPESARRNGANFVHDNIPWAYPMHDGTLADRGRGGFELVSHPFSYEWFLERWSSIRSMLDHLTSMGFRSWETKRCGMHIHISRAPMSEAHQMKFIRFIYGHTNLCLAIGQRAYNDPYLNRYAPFHREDRSLLIEKIRHNHNPGVEGHYTALSTNKRATIEGRWFRGTLNPDSFRKNIEFMHSVWHFTRNFGMVSSNEMNYIEWLRSHSSTYPILLKFIEHNYITRK